MSAPGPKIEVIPPGESVPRAVSDSGALPSGLSARAFRAIGGVVALAGAVVAGLFFGVALIAMTGLAMVAGTIMAVWMKWKMRKGTVIAEQKSDSGRVVVKRFDGPGGMGVWIHSSQAGWNSKPMENEPDGRD